MIVLRLVATIALCAGLIGCAEVARRSVASANDYAAYRRYRLATTMHSRLGASFDYLRTHPHGAFARDVRRWFEPASEARVEAAWDDLEALRFFLDAVPSGRAARLAASRVVELELAEEFWARKEEAFNERVRRIDERLSRAKEGRRALVRALSTWVGHLSRVREWGMRTSELDHSLIYAFRLSEPEGRCPSRNRCVKAMMFPYAIPEAKTQSDRVALMDVAMTLHEGGLEQITLTGPDLFTRVGEAVFVRPIAPTDLGGRTRALTRVLSIVEIAVEPEMPVSRCHVEPVSPVMLHRRCEGTELRVVAGTEPGQEDRIVVTPVTPEDSVQPAESTP